MTQLRVARAHHARLDHDEAFVLQVDAVIAAIAAMPRRFPVVVGDVRRALVRRYRYAIFFRIRETSQVIVLAALHQRDNPARWPR